MFVFLFGYHVGGLPWRKGWATEVSYLLLSVRISRHVIVISMGVLSDSSILWLSPKIFHLDSTWPLTQYVHVNNCLLRNTHIYVYFRIDNCSSRYIYICTSQLAANTLVDMYISDNLWAQWEGWFVICRLIHIYERVRNQPKSRSRACICVCRELKFPIPNILRYA